MRHPVVSCSRVEHSVDFTTAIKKKVLNITLSHYRQVLCIYCAHLWLLSGRDWFRWGHLFVLEVAVQPRVCFDFLQFPVTPPFLRISRAESTRRAAIFTVMDRKKCASLTRKFIVSLHKVFYLPSGICAKRGGKTSSSSYWKRLISYLR